MTFDYNIKKIGDIHVVKLAGDLIDKNQASAMMDDVENLITGGANKFVLDLVDIKYMSSSGLNVLINILTKARKSGGDVAIGGVSKKVNELLVITKLNTVFNVADSVDNAIEKVG